VVGTYTVDIGGNVIGIVYNGLAWDDVKPLLEAGIIHAGYIGLSFEKV